MRYFAFQQPFKSPLPKMTAKLAIPGLKLTGADTKDGSSAVGKGTTLVVSTSTVATSVGASAQQRPVSPLAKEQQLSSSESESDDDDARTEATATDLSDSERSDRDESPRPSPVRTSLSPIGVVCLLICCVS
jgi:hypothetical protein